MSVIPDGQEREWYKGYEIVYIVDDWGDLCYELHKDEKVYCDPYICFEEFEVAQEWARSDVDERIDMESSTIFGV